MVKKLGTLVDKECEFIHSPFNGERIFGRESLSAKIKYQDAWQDAKLWSYSPFGVEFVDCDYGLERGKPIDLKINLAGDETEFRGLIVNSVREDNGTKLAGVRTFIKDKTTHQEYSGIDRRSHRRWSCSEDFLPTGTAPNPVRYNDYVLFRVDDISSGGLRLITSMRNKFLGVGQKLEGNLSLPYVGTVKIDVKIKYVNTTFYREKEFMVMGVEFIKKDPIMIKSLGEYLLNFDKDVTIKSLNKEGFNIKSISKWLDFSYVKTEEDYRDVLELRLRAYKSVGKVPKDAKPEDMMLDIDSRSNLLVAKHNGKIVASISYVIPNNEDDLITKDDFIYSAKLPKISEIGSTWRFCVDKDFRSADVTYLVIAYVVYNFIRNGRRYWLSTAEKNILDFYKKCGVTEAGISYSNVALKNMSHEVILMDAYEVVKGKGMSPKNWNVLYKDLLNYLLETGQINLSPLEKMRVWLYNLIGTILNYN